MLFTQFEFIFLFLPVALAGYFLIGKLAAAPVARIVWLAAASLFFYGYWDVSFLPIICVSIAGNYLAAVLVSRQADPHRRLRIFAAAVGANLLALIGYKYTNFGIDIFNGVTRQHLAHLAIVLPLGISFFTFTQIAYLVDVYRGQAIERCFARYVLFVTFFPHLIAGPILHHREMMPQFGSIDGRRISAQNVALGLTIFAVGLFKKIIIADSFALIANPVFQTANQMHLRAMDAWAGALAYSLQIYFDFSGYSDMAVGLSLLFGIRLPFNFDAPYKARSITEFWRRWHITLSRFLRDYLYIPLGGNRFGASRRNLNLFATMALGGLWHGAGWTFLIWGMLHGGFLIVNHRWSTYMQRSPLWSILAGKSFYGIAALALTQLAVVVAWVFFRADTPIAAVRVIKAMAGAADASKMSPDLIPAVALLMIAAGYVACLVLPNVNAMFEKWNVGLETYSNARRWSIVALQWRPGLSWAFAAAAMFVVAVVASLLAGDGSQFLYFQF